jgi:hypothetical protein
MTRWIYGVALLMLERSTDFTWEATDFFPFIDIDLPRAGVVDVRIRQSRGPSGGFSPHRTGFNP